MNPIGYSSFNSGEACFLYEKVDHSNYDYSVSSNAAPESAHDSAPESISLFPSIFARQHSSDAKRRILASVDNKDQYRITPMLDKNQTLKLIEKLGGELARLNDGEVNDLLKNLLGSIHQLSGPAIPIELWANMSLRLDILLGILNTHSNKELPTLAYIKVIVGKLDYVCRYTWKQQAYEQLIKTFKQAFEQLVVTNPVASEVRAIKGTVEVATPLDMMSVSGSAGREVSFIFDDEGYGKTTRSITGDFALNIKLPAIFKAKGQVTGAKGNYNYSRTAEYQAICYFNELLVNNLESGLIDRYLSRRRTLGVQDHANEMSDFYADQKEYLLTAEANARAFAVMMSLDYAGSTVRYSGPGTVADPSWGETINYSAIHPSGQLKKNQSQIIPPKITANTNPVYGAKKKAIVVNGKTETITGIFAGKAGLDTSIYEGSAELRIEGAKKKSVNTRYATLIDLLDNKYANAKQPFKEKLSRDIQKSGAAIRKKVAKNWYPKPTSKLVFDDATCQLWAANFRRNPDSFPKDTLIRLVQEPAFIRAAPNAWSVLLQDLDQHWATYTRSQLIELLGMPAVREKHRAKLEALARDCQDNPDGYTKRHIALLMQIPGIAEIAPDVCVRTDLAQLTRDFDFLENLHAQRAMGHGSVDKSIARFYRIYDAKNTEECLKNMAVLAAYLYAQLGRQKSVALATGLKELETRIVATGIPHRPDVLRELAGASQDYYATTSSITVTFSLKNGFKFSSAKAVVPGLGFKATISKLRHYNPSRSGKSYNVEITFSGDAGLDRQVLDALSAFLKLKGAHDTAGYVESQYVAGKFAKGTFVVRDFLPSQPGAMRRVRLYKRAVTQTGYEIVAAIPISVPGCAGMKLGASYSASSTDLVMDMPEPDSMLLFIIHYLHGIFTGTIQLDRSDPDNFKEVHNADSQDSYWHSLLGQQETLKQLFLNIAQGKLSAEFDHLQHRYLAYASDDDRVKVARAQSRLLASADQFRSTRSYAEYLNALESFKAFMRSLYDHWIWTRELSDVYEPYQYKFHLTPIPCAKRRHGYTRTARVMNSVHRKHVGLS